MSSEDDHMCFLATRQRLLFNAIDKYMEVQERVTDVEIRKEFGDIFLKEVQTISALYTAVDSEGVGRPKETEARRDRRCCQQTPEGVPSAQAHACI